jgi:hypothetical protein
MRCYHVDLPLSAEEVDEVRALMGYEVEILCAPYVVPEEAGRLREQQVRSDEDVSAKMKLGVA